MKPNARRIATGLLLTGLTAGSFLAGARLAQPHAAGRDLLADAREAGRPKTGLTVASLAYDRPHGLKPDADAASSEGGDADAPAALFDEVYSYLKRDYVDGVPPDSQLAHGAAAAMVASLGDPNSRFLDPAEMTEVGQEAQGVYHGLGAITAVRKVWHPKQGDALAYLELRLTVVDVLPGSPAEKAGLLPGDVITHVNTQWVAGFDPEMAEYPALKALAADPVSLNKRLDAIEKMEKTSITIAQAQTMLRDGSAKTLTVGVTRLPGHAPDSPTAGAEQLKPAPGPQTLTLTSALDGATSAPAVESRVLPGEIGYLKITQFTDATPDQVDAALQSFGTGPKGVVIDLRGSPGGLLDSAAAVAARLTTQPTLGLLVGKGDKKTPIALTPRRPFACPVAVLIDGGTAQVSELLAAALKQDGATLIGARTFGDAAEVKPVSLRDGSGFTMTVGQMETSAGKSFAGSGIKPDLALADPDGDAPITRAVETLSGRMARIPSHGG